MLQAFVNIRSAKKKKPPFFRRLREKRGSKAKNMDNFKKISRNLLVMARSQPIHKYALVLGIKSLENVVAVSGDGTNDAPALS
ncbi:MAG: hypothetical protein IJ705_06365, partial [Oscillospiraceae bacterium]|nr:hypothetical protein [Oscillospiraceae bacterium]